MRDGMSGSFVISHVQRHQEASEHTGVDLHLCLLKQLCLKLQKPVT